MCLCVCMCNSMKFWLGYLRSWQYQPFSLDLKIICDNKHSESGLLPSVSERYKIFLPTPNKCKTTITVILLYIRLCV